MHEAPESEPDGLATVAKEEFLDVASKELLNLLAYGTHFLIDRWEMSLRQLPATRG